MQTLEINLLGKKGLYLLSLGYGYFDSKSLRVTCLKSKVSEAEYTDTLHFLFLVSCHKYISLLI
jgi:hypothetical protein